MFMHLVKHVGFVLSHSKSKMLVQKLFDFEVFSEKTSPPFTFSFSSMNNSFKSYTTIKLYKYTLEYAFNLLGMRM